MHKILLTLAILFIALNVRAQDFCGHDWDNEWLHIKHPTVELTYGLSKANLDGFTGSFENVSLFDIKLGFSNEKYMSKKKGLSKYVFGYFDFGNTSSDIDAREKTDGKLQSSNWRFGFGKKDGYPINFGSGSFSILPYTSTAIMWTRIDMKQLPDSSNLTDLNWLLLYDKTFRFGNTWDGGLSFNITRNFALDVGFERSNTYQRYLFWKNTGSFLIQEAGAGLIDEFVSHILYREPVAGSIVSFLLKNAYYYGIFQLRSKEMNWPFGGEASFNFDTYKFGVTVTF